MFKRASFWREIPPTEVNSPPMMIFPSDWRAIVNIRPLQSGLKLSTLCALMSATFAISRNAENNGKSNRLKLVAKTKLALQRRFERFPFFEFFHAAFTVGFVGLVV